MRGKVSPLLPVGTKFGMVTVIESGLRLPPTPSQVRLGKHGVHGVRIECECGAVKMARSRDLRRGRIVSCGACRVRKASRKDGRRSHPYYGTWASMMQRCGNPNSRWYSNYGGRGIKVWEPWRDPGVFLAYLDAVLGPRPEGCSLDRIDNDGDYAPGNLRWATRTVQAANRRPRRSPVD